MAGSAEEDAKKTFSCLPPVLFDFDSHSFLDVFMTLVQLSCSCGVGRAIFRFLSVESGRTFREAKYLYF